MPSKTFFRDYAVNAFDLYANADKARQKTSAMRADIEAVQKTIEELNEQGKSYVVDAVKEIYMLRRLSDKHLTANNNQVQRVLWYCTNHYVSQANVYRWLNLAILMFCEFRGLNTFNWEIEKKTHKENVKIYNENKTFTRV